MVPSPVSSPLQHCSTGLAEAGLATEGTCPQVQGHVAAGPHHQEHIFAAGLLVPPGPEGHGSTRRAQSWGLLRWAQGSPRAGPLSSPV